MFLSYATGSQPLNLINQNFLCSMYVPQFQIIAVCSNNSSMYSLWILLLAVTVRSS
jgi:hypothetical protein